MIKEHLCELGIEEVGNVITHGFGFVLSIAGFIFLAFLAAENGGTRAIAGAAVYGISLVALYAASTVYHSTITPRWKSFFQLLDHCCIFVLIAGSYTLFLLIVMRGAFGTALLVLVWLVALFGIVMKVMYRDRLNALGIVLYLTLGWLGVVAIGPIYSLLGRTPLIFVLAGGLSYTVGMVFFGWKAMRHHHAIFHVFVLCGSIFHYIVIAGYVIPLSP